MNTIRNLLTNLCNLLVCACEAFRYGLTFLRAILCSRAVLAAKLLAVESQLAACKHVELVELHPRISRIHLHVEGRGFDGLLLLARQLGQAVGKSISNAKFHILSLIKTTNRLCTPTNMAACVGQLRRWRTWPTQVSRLLIS